ncbi:cytochrome b561 domain-containing protein 1-like [Notechis scutatus]|uniref:ascorbate ferrireductase (transmembrane) n=1 Tax=Notechis scutatus TaxID=8663 RepID=A0A6J1V2D0_9SAUR|nr:cytochrome b561 domain-containing protein 1-like [Notechis scutatus]XP_026533999.1 cytochrome b561 domain-containing protein 1-like [Notechis scutatus]
MPDAPAGCRVWLRRGCGALAHLAAWGMTVFLLLLSRPGTSLFSWHPVFMSIAFCLCLTEALLIFSPEASLFFCSHKAKVQLHWIAQMLALVAATLGLVFIISSKNRSELPHFISWHSILGLVTILATCGQVLCGLGLLFPQLLRISLAAQLWRCHTVYGLIVYLLATSTVVLGICSDWFQAQIKGIAWYLCLGLIFCPALVIMNQISRTCLSKKRQYV